jgi:MFS family permease
VSFAVAAALLIGVHLPQRGEAMTAEPFLQEFRQGWQEFRRQDWIWTTIVFFGIANFAFQARNVLAPVVMKDHYNGASTYGVFLAAFGAGLIVGGVVALRWRPNRILLVSCLASTPLSFSTIALAFLAPVPVLLALQALAGIGLAVHLALWFTVFQQEVPEHARSRVSSYDSLGSFVLVPVGLAVAGPIAGAIGITATLLASAATMLVTKGIVVSRPSVWAIRRRAVPGPVPA